MIAIPAVDLRDGACVQLVGGSFAQEKVRIENPVDVARSWEHYGFHRLHVVDLDAATGHGSNITVVRSLLFDSGVPIQVGGGVRSSELVEELLEAGASRVIVGTRAIEEPEWLAELAARHPGEIIVACDVRERRVTTRGWAHTLPLDILDVVDELNSLPLAGMLVTADGTTTKIGNRVFTVHLSNDAHSKSDIMIEVDNGVLFTGDNVLNKRVARMDDGSFVGTIKEIDRALSLPVKVIVPGHGKTGGREVLTAQKAYLQTLFDAVKTEYDLGKSDFEMKPVLEKKLAKFKHWHGFDAALGKHVSLAVLEIEQQ